MKYITYSSENLVNAINIEIVKIEVSKHFKNKWMKKWNWDYNDIRDAIQKAYKLEKVGKKKYEVYIRKKGEKKIVLVYYLEIETMFIITGAEG